MKKSTLALIGAGVLFAGAEFMYESVLNTKFAPVMAKKLNLMDETLVELFKNNELFRNSIIWFKKLNLTDTAIRNSAGEDIHAYILKQNEETDKWAICVHGYMCTPSAQSPFIKHFYENGYNVICPSLKGHGEDSGKYCSMGYHDKNIVISWIDYITNINPHSRIVLHGVSMGGATVMLVSGEKLPENVKCIISDCGYSSCKDVFAHVLKHNLGLPSFPLLNAASIVSEIRGNFRFSKCSPRDAVAHSSTPTLFIHGTADDFVPYSMIDEVYNACTAEKERLDVADAPHGAALAFAPEEYFERMDSFIGKYF